MSMYQYEPEPDDYTLISKDALERALEMQFTDEEADNLLYLIDGADFGDDEEYCLELRGINIELWQHIRRELDVQGNDPEYSHRIRLPRYIHQLSSWQQVLAWYEVVMAEPARDYRPAIATRENIWWFHD